MCLFSALGLCSTEHSSLFVCQKNEQFEQNGAVYELYLLCMRQKSSFYMPHEGERTSGNQEMQTFWASSKVAFLATFP